MVLGPGDQVTGVVDVVDAETQVAQDQFSLVLGNLVMLQVLRVGDGEGLLGRKLGSEQAKRLVISHCQPRARLLYSSPLSWWQPG